MQQDRNLPKRKEEQPLGADRAPLYERLLKHARSHAVSFHVPGHKGLSTAYGSPLAAFSSAVSDIGILDIDVTEITGLDDLHHPSGAIRDAQCLAAECFGAEQTYFLIAGSTVGNLALITTVCEPGDILIVQRNVHKSIINGLKLSGAKAVFLPSAWDPETRQSGTVRLEDVEEALRRYPAAKGVMLTNPNYYGMTQPLAPLVQAAHACGVPVLVDEAHGAHFGFHPALPPSALSQGADGVVQSTHKMLPAMTMAAMLHVQGGLLDRRVLEQRLGLLQSSSPSYPLLASLDLARRLLHVQGAGCFADALRAVERFRLTVAGTLHGFGVHPRLTPIGCAPHHGPAAGESGGEAAAGPQPERFDPFKALLYDRTGRLDGFALQRELEQRGCMCEMADPRYAVLFFSLKTTEEHIDRLLSALNDIDQQRRGNRNAEGSMEDLSNPEVHCEAEFGLTSEESLTRMRPAAISEPVAFRLSRPAAEVPVKSVPLKKAVGLICAESVVPYPPGIPVLYEGETVSQGIVDELLELARLGAKFQGAADEGLGTIQIFEASDRHI